MEISVHIAGSLQITRVAHPIISDPQTINQLLDWGERPGAQPRFFLDHLITFVDQPISSTATSPWNAFAATPPVVVDSQGNFYGYFTANKLDPKRTTVESLLYILSNGDYIRSHFEEIVKEMQ